MRRTVTLAVVLVAVTLTACDTAATNGANGTQRVGDLAADALFNFETGQAPFDSVDEFLALLPFDPVYPAMVPGDRQLERASVVPSPFARPDRGDAADNRLTYLILQYSGGGGSSDWMSVTQRLMSMPTVAGAPTEEVRVGSHEGLLIQMTQDALELVWEGCDRLFTIQSPVLERDEIIAMGESITDDCPAP